MVTITDKLELHDVLMTFLALVASNKGPTPSPWKVMIVINAQASNRIFMVHSILNNLVSIENKHNTFPFRFSGTYRDSGERDNERGRRMWPSTNYKAPATSRGLYGRSCCQTGPSFIWPNLANISQNFYLLVFWTVLHSEWPKLRQFRV